VIGGVRITTQSERDLVLEEKRENHGLVLVRGIPGFAILIETKVYLLRLQREISDGMTPESVNSGLRCFAFFFLA